MEIWCLRMRVGRETNRGGCFSDKQRESGEVVAIKKF